jgi:anti-anti-sigma regulatory factor
MSAEVRVRLHRGATVVSATGVADGTLLGPLTRALVVATADADLVVVDLDELTLLDADGLRGIIRAMVDAGRAPRLRLVTRRRSAAAVLARWRVHHLVPVHRTVDDAISVHRYLAGRVTEGAASVRRRTSW